MGISHSTGGATKTAVSLETKVERSLSKKHAHTHRVPCGSSLKRLGGFFLFGSESGAALWKDGEGHVEQEAHLGVFQHSH